MPSATAPLAPAGLGLCLPIKHTHIVRARSNTHRTTLTTLANALPTLSLHRCSITKHHSTTYHQLHSHAVRTTPQNLCKRSPLAHLRHRTSITAANVRPSAALPLRQRAAHPADARRARATRHASTTARHDGQNGITRRPSPPTIIRQERTGRGRRRHE